MRSALYMGAVVTSRRNNALREFYQRLLEADKTEKVALTVCTRDLLAPSQLGGYCIEFHDAVGVLPVTPRAALFGTLVHQTQVAIFIVDGGRHFNPDKQLREILRRKPIGGWNVRHICVRDAVDSDGIGRYRACVLPAHEHASILPDNSALPNRRLPRHGLHCSTALRLVLPSVWTAPEVFVLLLG